MMNEKLAVPRLYLYSVDDELCHVDELEKLLNQKQQQ